MLEAVRNELVPVVDLVVPEVRLVVGQLFVGPLCHVRGCIATDAHIDVLTHRGYVDLIIAGNLEVGEGIVVL